MKKYQEPNYNIDGVDLNIYTVKRDDDIEYCLLYTSDAADE